MPPVRKTVFTLGALFTLSIALLTVAKADPVTLSFQLDGQRNVLGASVFQFVLSGNSGALGTASYVDNVTVVSINPDVSRTINGAFTITFGNLGTITGTSTGIIGAPSLDPTTQLIRSSLNRTLTITGGTGVFAGATGTLSYTGTDLRLDVDVARVTLTVNGTITAPGLTAPIPEPATLMLLGTGLVGVAARLQRRRQSGNKNL